MVRINLRDYYQTCQSDMIIEVSEEVFEQLLQWERDEWAYKRQRYRHKAHYSLDREDGIERDALFISLSPYEMYERSVTNEQLYSAIAMLPDKQAKRIYARFVMNMSLNEIARAEKVSAIAISASIARGLQRLAQILKEQ